MKANKIYSTVIYRLQTSAVVNVNTFPVNCIEKKVKAQRILLHLVKLTDVVGIHWEFWKLLLKQVRMACSPLDGK